MISSDSWQVLKDKVAYAFDRHEFQEVEDTILDCQFWAQVMYVLDGLFETLNFETWTYH